MGKAGGEEVSNPNNCATCDHKKHPDGGHCYMFKDAPKQVCKQHTPPHFIARQWVSRIAIECLYKGKEVKT